MKPDYLLLNVPDNPACDSYDSKFFKNVPVVFYSAIVAYNHLD